MCVLCLPGRHPDGFGGWKAEIRLKNPPPIPAFMEGMFDLPTYFSSGYAPLVEKPQVSPYSKILASAISADYVEKYKSKVKDEPKFLILGDDWPGFDLNLGSIWKGVDK